MRAGMDLLYDTAFLFLLLSILVLILFIVAFVLTALRLRRENARKANRWARLEARWRPLVLRTLSGEVRAEEVWPQVGPEERFYFVDLLFRYAQRFRGEERRILARLAGPFLPEVASRIRAARDPEQRARALQTVALLGLDGYDREIVEALDDPAPLVAMVAARSLARNDRARHARQLLDRLERFEAWSPAYLISMLTAFGPELAPALRRTLASEARPAWVRAVAADALRALNDPTAAAVAHAVLRATAIRVDTELTAAALRLLGAIGGAEHLATIRTFVASPDEVVRTHAIRAIGEIGETADREHLRAALDDDSAWVAIRAAEGLRELGEVRLLLEIAASDHPKADLARQVLAEA